jgi:hypothetical protein
MGESGGIAGSAGAANFGRGGTIPVKALKWFGDPWQGIPELVFYFFSSCN